MKEASLASRERTTVSPAFLLLLGALLALVAFFLIRPALSGLPYYRPRPPGTAHDYWYLVVLAFGPYAVALRSHRRGRRTSLAVLIVSAALLYAALVPAPPQQSQDVYQYLLYGRMSAGGTNPYVDAPDARDPWLAFTLWDDTPSVYGPAWTLISAGAVRASRGSLTAALLLVKGAAAALAIAATVALALAGRRRSPPGSDPAFAVLAFAFNPLVLVSVGVGAHADVAVSAAFAAAILAHRRGRDRTATLVLVLASLVKAYAGLALVAWLLDLARRRGSRAAAMHLFLGAAVAIAAWTPYWEGASTLRGFGRIGRQASASLGGGLARLLSGRWDVTAGGTAAGAAVGIIGIATLVAAVAWIARSPRAPRDPWRAAALLFTVYFLVTPWYLHWHVLGLVALVAGLTPGTLERSVLVFSATSLIVAPGGVQTAVRYLPPIAAATFSRRAGRPGSP